MIARLGSLSNLGSSLAHLHGPADAAGGRVTLRWDFARGRRLRSALVEGALGQPVGG
jgi:hypothetical protein